MKRRSGQVWLITSAALNDLRHEWVISICVILAVFAITTPVLLLYGIKQGTITALRERLLQDPVFREIRPAQTLNNELSFFSGLAEMNGVGFIVPTMTRGAASVLIRTREGRPVDVDLLPTAPGDPLLSENGGTAPVQGEVVLSAIAAQELNLQEGSLADLEVIRRVEGDFERVRLSLTVRAILDERASAQPVAYVPLEVTRNVESYKQGFAVPERGWPGATPEAYPSFDGLYILSDERISRRRLATIGVTTGFSVIEENAFQDLLQRLSLDIPDYLEVTKLSVVSRPAGTGSVEQVEERLRGQTSAIVPFTKDVRLSIDDGPEFRLVGIGPDRKVALLADLWGLPWQKPEGPMSPLGTAGPIILPDSLGYSEGDIVSVRMPGDGSALELSLYVVGTHDKSIAFSPLRLAGQLRTAGERSVKFEKLTSQLVLGGNRFFGFRLYADDISNVPAIVTELEGIGVKTISKVQSIMRLIALDNGLTELFVVIFLISLSGGVGVLAASAYASVSRKAQIVSLLRLIGMSPASVSLFPIVQVVALSFAGGVLACFATVWGLSVVSGIMQVEGARSQDITFLKPSDYAVALAITVAFSTLASAAAVARCRRIAPAESLGHE